MMERERWQSRQWLQPPPDRCALRHLDRQSEGAPPFVNRWLQGRGGEALNRIRVHTMILHVMTWWIRTWMVSQP